MRQCSVVRKVIPPVGVIMEWVTPKYVMDNGVYTPLQCTGVYITLCSLCVGSIESAKFGLLCEKISLTNVRVKDILAR